MHTALEIVLAQQLETLSHEGRAKGQERPIRALVPAEAGRGQRYLLAGSEQAYIKMNSNDYLGLATHPALIAAAEEAGQRYGIGPGAVRFISGTQTVHTRLEAQLAAFHQREDSIIFNSAYAAVLSTISVLTSPESAILSDELNHNCIINGIRLSRPGHKAVYRHRDMADLTTKLEAVPASCKRLLVITDGIFSMRGSHAPLQEIRLLLDGYQDRFVEGISLIVDDSHGVGAFGTTGRGSEEVTHTRADVLIGTLGKAFGVNGGYVTGSRVLTSFLRETSPTYIYSNPIGPAEAAAACTALELLDQAEGQQRLANLRTRTEQFESGLARLGFEFLSSQHPVTPLMLRDSKRTQAYVQQLFEGAVLATGIVYPVVPKGDESIRFQVNAHLSEQDVTEVLTVLQG